LDHLLQVRQAERAGSESAWRSFLSRFLLTVVLGLFGVGTLNYFVNPEGLYGTHFVPQILWGSRPQKAAMLKSVQPPPEALIMGSSRVMNILPAEVQAATGLRTFNAGVDLAKAEDFYILLRYAVEEAHLRPKLLILGCDVEVFHNHERVHYYLQQPSLLASFLWHSESQHWRWHSFTKLLSHEETQLSMESLYKSVRGKTTPFSHVEADGHVEDDEWERERAAGQQDLQREIRSTIDRFSPRYYDYSGLSEERLAYFDATLRYAHDHGIQTVVFLTPTHPAVEEGLRPHGYAERKQEVTAALQRISSAWSVPFYDFSSPEAFGGDPKDFYDGVHYDETFAPRMIAKMLPVRAHAVQ
jgi:hypothetical protein